MKLTNLLSIFPLAILILAPLILAPVNTGIIYTTSPRITRAYVDRCIDIVESGYYEVIGNIFGTQRDADYCMRIFANNVVLDGKGYNLTSGYDYKVVIGVLISRASNITIRNLTISRYTFSILVLNSSNIVITNNVVDHYQSGVVVRYSELIDIANNTIVNNIRASTHIYIERSRAGCIKHNTLINNYWSSGIGIGIMLISSNLIVIDRNNLVNRNDYNYFDGVTLINSDSNEVLNNFIVNCTGYSLITPDDVIGYGSGINLVNSHNNLVVGNSIERRRVSENGRYGIRIDKSSGNSISLNAVSSYRYGIYIANSRNNIVAINEIVKNIYGIEIIRSSDNIVFGNYIINNSARGMYIENSTNNTNYNNYLFNNVNVDTKNVSFNMWSVELQQSKNIIGGQWIGGNAWLRPDGKGYSQICVDELEPIGICDEPYYITKDNIDYYPLSIKSTPTPSPTPTPTPRPTPTPTHLRTVYVNAFVGFYLPLPPIEFYRIPISSEITLCNVRASYVGGNIYVVEVPKTYVTCVVKIRDPIGITSAFYEEVVSIADSIDVVIPDTSASLTLLAISWMLLVLLYLSVKQAFSHAVTITISFFVAINIMAVAITLVKPSLFPGFYTALVEMLMIVVASTKLATIEMDQYRKKKAEERKVRPTKLKKYEEILQEVLNKSLSCIPRKDYSEDSKIQLPNWLKQLFKVELSDEMYLIGCGAQGCVYACGNYAVKIPSNLVQALKTASKSFPTINIEFVDEFKKEVEIVQKLKHDNILKLVDYSINPPMLVYELADGSLENCGKLDLRDILLISIQICEALRYLHSRGVVHGDLKPSNILIVKGIVKVGDLSSLTHLLVTMSDSYPTKCTRGYCAPEQLFIDLKTNPNRKGFENRVDVYQLANSILTTLGIPPLDGSDWDKDKICERIERVKIEELKDMLKSMLMKEPWLRPSIDEIEKELLRIWEKYFRTG